MLPFLDPAVVIADRKPFVGYSDNTNLLNWLWNLGVAGHHGGSTMVHLGRGGGLHPVSASSLRAALLTGGDVELHPVGVFREDELDWSDPASLEHEPPSRPSPGWSWHQPVGVVTAPTWGGNLEILHWNLAANRWIRPVEDYAGCVREAILRALERYNPAAMAVFNIDLGHTDPQWIMPYGGTVTVDGPARRITAHY